MFKSPQPTMQTLPICRLTRAACELAPPKAVRMPLRDLHAAQDLRGWFRGGRGSAATLVVLEPLLLRRRRRGRQILPDGGAGAGVDALGQQLARLRPPSSSPRDRRSAASSWFRSSAGMRLALRASSLRDQPFVDQVDGDAHGGEAGPLGVAGLQHPDLAALDRELDVLHVACSAFRASCRSRPAR